MDIPGIMSVKNSIINLPMQYGITEKLFNRIKILTVIITALLTVSCEDFFTSEATNVNIPGGESRLVVYSYISPQDTVIRVHVHRSVPYYRQVKTEPVSGQAIVTLARKGGERSVLEYSENHQCFIIKPDEFKIEPGLIYELSAELENGEYVKAECYVPELEYENIWSESVPTDVDEYGNGYFAINWKITTRKNQQGNYYSSGAYVKSSTIIHKEGRLDTFSYYNDLWMEKGSRHFPDEGRTWSFKARHSRGIYYYPPDYYVYPEPNPDDEYVDSIFIYVMQTDKNYYLFNKSYENYNNYGDDFPFAESVLIYSNIEGGLGVFAGYNRKNLYVQALSKMTAFHGNKK